MATELAITGYPSSWRAPFTAAEILFAQGASTASAGARDAFYCAPMTSAGTWTANTVYEVANEQQAITGAGPGSPLHRLIRKHLRANKNGKVFAQPYAATSGGTEVAATGTIVVASNPTASGQLRAWVCGERIDVNFTTASTPTTIGDDIEAKINAKTHLPCTASNAAGTVTLTAKIPGASQGDATVGVIRFRAEIDAGKTTTVTTSGAALGLGTGTAGADGAVTEEANLTAALATITASRFYYMGFSVWSASHTAVIEAHVATKSEPNPGLRSTAITGYTHTLAAGALVAIARNAERHQIVWQKNSEHDTADLVGNLIGVLQKREQTDAAYNFDDYNESDWQILPAYAEADWPDGDDLNDAVTDGLIPVASNQTGSRIIMMVTTRSKDSAGTLDDFRATERHRVSVMDLFVDELLLQFSLTYKNFKLKDDQRLPDGTVNPNQRILGRVLTPSRFRGWFNARIQDFEDRNLFQGAQAWKDGAEIRVDPQNVSRLQVGASGRTIDLLHQASFRLAETTPA